MRGNWGPSKAQEEAQESTDPVRLAALASAGASFARSAVAANPHTPAEALRRLAANGDSYNATAVAGNPSAPSDLLDDLARRGTFEQRKVATNPNTSTATLAYLARAAPDAHRALASNPALDAETLAVLAQGDDERCLATVAGRTDTPEGVVVALARTARSPLVIYALIHRGEDDSTPVRVVTVRRFNGRSTYEEDVRFPVQVPGRLSEALMRAMCENPSHMLHRCVASQPDAPTDLLDGLAEHSDLWVRVNLASNPGTPPSALTSLLEAPGVGSETEVMTAIASREDLSDAMLDQIAATRSSSAHKQLGVSASAVRRLAESKIVRSRVVAAALVGQDTEVRDLLLVDPEVKVREAVARAVPHEDLVGLVGHESRQVRAVVAERCADVALLDALALDDAALVRRRVAANTSTSATTIAALIEDGDARVRELATQRFLTALA